MLGVNQIKVRNPVIQDHASPKVGENYKFQSTTELIDLIEAQGFICDHNGINRAGVRRANQANLGYQQHLVPFDIATEGEFKDLRCVLKDSKFRLLVFNSHNGLGSLKLKLGIFRFICANGIVVGDVMSSFAINHRGHDFNVKVKAAIALITAQAKKVQSMVHKMENTKLNHQERCRLAKMASEIRWDTEDCHIWNMDLLERKRIEDMENDLWTVFNVLQENILGGGVPVFKNGKTKKSKKITNISKQTKINEELWRLAERFVA